MSARPWYKRYGGDFIAGTINLTGEQKAVYSVILDAIYDRGAPIPDDAQWIARIGGVSVRRWRQIRAVLIELGKIRIIDGHISNDRAERQLGIEAAEAIAAKESGARGGRARAAKSGLSPDDLDLKSRKTEDKSVENSTNAADVNGLDEKTLAETSKQAQKLREASKKQQQSSSESVHARETDRVARSLMPRRSDPPECWMIFADRRPDGSLMTEINDDGPEQDRKLRPCVGGYYFDIVADLVCEAARIIDPNWRGDWGTLATWLRDDLTPHEHILPAIRRVMGRPNAPPAVGSLKFFDAAVREQAAINRRNR